MNTTTYSFAHILEVEEALYVLEQHGLMHEDSAEDLLALACRNHDTNLSTYREWAAENA